MILCDSSVWLALAIVGHVHHVACRSWLETVETPRSIYFCRATQVTFLRLLTTQAVLTPYGRPPLSNRAAWDVLGTLFDDDRVALHRAEPPEIETAWHRYAATDTASPKLWMDAYLAAYAHVGGFSLVTTDSAFRRFADLDLLVLG